MKIPLTTAALVFALIASPLCADEPKASAPAAQENIGDGPSAKPVTGEPDSAGKPPKTNASSSARKVATDYAPAQDLLLSAMGLIGVKYKWGGSTPESGLDCSGFIKYVFQNSLNIVLPRTALGMSNMGDTIEKEELKPGDLVFFNTLKRKFSHVGIYLGDGRFIHSPRKGRNIEVAEFDNKYWAPRFNGARRVSELGEASIDVAALLAGRPRPPATASTGKSCKKVTSVRNGKKVTSTVCSVPKTSKAKPASAKPGGKASTPAKGVVKAKTPVKKPAAKK